MSKELHHAIDEIEDYNNFIAWKYLLSTSFIVPNCVANDRPLMAG